MKVIGFGDDHSLQESFLQVPRTLYANDPNWLGDPATGRMGTEQQGSERRHFLVIQGEEVLGRVSACINRSLLDKNGAEYGQLAFFECVNDEAAAQALIEESVAWLRGKLPGGRHVLAPMDLDTWHAYRLRTAGFDEMSFPMEPHNPKYYPGLLLASGFEVAARYVTKLVTDPQIPMHAWEPAYQRAMSHGFRFRTFDPSRRTEDLHLIFRLATTMFRQNAYYVDISPEEFARLYGGEAGRMDAADLIIALDPQSEPVGFSYTSPDLRNQHMLNIKTFGTLPRVHGRGVGAALAMETYRRGMARGFTAFQHCLMRAGNEADLMDRGGAHVTREYALYSRSLAA